MFPEHTQDSRGVLLIDMFLLSDMSLPENSAKKTRSSWLNCALRDDEAVYWVSIGHYEAVAVGNW